MLLFLVSSIVCSDVLAKKMNQAQIARGKNLTAITVFVDISVASRKNGAATKMTKLHQQFARQGYELVDINIYTENGDLQGFFVSYKSSKSVINDHNKIETGTAISW